MIFFKIYNNIFNSLLSLISTYEIRIAVMAECMNRTNTDKCHRYLNNIKEREKQE